MTLALLCPTKGRSEKCLRMLKSVQQTGSDEIRKKVYLGLSLEDYNDYETSYIDLILPDKMPTAHKWNLLAEQALKDSEHKLFMLCADDVIFSTPLWDKALLDHYNALENKVHVYSLRDSRDSDGTPHPIVTREYIEAMGYFLPPIFLHWFVDSWTVEIAKANNCFTHLKDYELIHDKSNDKGTPDETHLGIRSMGWLERDTWVSQKLKPTYFGLECQRLKWAMDKRNAA